MVSKELIFQLSFIKYLQLVFTSKSHKHTYTQVHIHTYIHEHATVAFSIESKTDQECNNNAYLYFTVRQTLHCLQKSLLFCDGNILENRNRNGQFILKTTLPLTLPSPLSPPPSIPPSLLATKHYAICCILNIMCYFQTSFL